MMQYTIEYTYKSTVIMTLKMIQSNRAYLYIFYLVMLCITACDKVPKGTQQTPVIADSLASGYFICNEGNFQWSNASLSFYNIKKNVLYDDVYKSVNKKPLGDVLQSITIFNNTAYLVVNNSGKIELINPTTFESTGTITGLRSPRFFLGIQTNKAYVSDLYDNAISVIDLDKKTVANKIACTGWTEAMLLYGNRVFVTNKHSRYLYIVNTTNDAVVDSIYIGYGSQSIQADGQNRLWVLTDGNSALSIVPQLHIVDPNALKLIKTFNFLPADKPVKIIVDPTATQLFWINKQVFKMSINDQALPATPWIEAGNRNLYAIGYDKTSNEVVVADAKDYVQRSEILRYNSSGIFLGSYPAGINSTYFLSK